MVTLYELRDTKSNSLRLKGLSKSKLNVYHKSRPERHQIIAIVSPLSLLVLAHRLHRIMHHVKGQYEVLRHQ